ncbi:hypothetical protein ACWAT4_25425 [Bradyrhizobium manausense]
MYIRCAFFSGRIKPGRETEFTAYVREKLVPLWTRFPGAEEVRVLRQEESDSDAQRYEMVLAIRYPSREAIEEALASPVRFESREVTKGLTEMFDGSIFHTVFKADDFALPTD